MYTIQRISNKYIPPWDGLVVSVFASCVVDHGFAPFWVISKTIIKIVQTASVLGTHALG